MVASARGAEKNQEFLRLSGSYLRPVIVTLAAMVPGEIPWTGCRFSHMEQLPALPEEIEEK